MAKISVDISANVTGTDGVNEFAKSMQDAQKSVSEFSQSQAAGSLQGVADALKEFATNALKASEAFGAMGRVQLPQAQATSSSQSATSAQNDAAALSSQVKATIKDSTRTLEDRLEWLTDAIDKARDKLDEAVESQDSLATQSWGDTTAELEMQRDRLKAEQAAEERKAAATSTGAGGADKLANYFLSQGIGQAAGLVFQGMNIGSSYRMDMANGNYLGAGVNVERGVGNIVSSGSQTVGGIIGMLVNPLVGAGVSLLGSLVGGVLDADANRREADIAEGQRYQQLFTPKYNTARLYGGAITDAEGKTTKYGGILSKSDHKDEKGRDVWEATSVEDNATWSNELVNRAELQARGTGLSITDFMNASQTYATAGVTSADQAFKLTREAANWTKSTGASMDSLMRLQSLGAQYGVGDNVIRTAYGGLKASGMERGQFDEFLSGLQTVIENGIANGFVKSAEDVASELSLFARLSGNNPLWQGQNGVNTLMQLNQGLAGATAMQTPEQVAAVSAAKDVLERYASGEGFEKAKQEYIAKLEKDKGRKLTAEELGAITQNDVLSNYFGITATGGWTDYMQLLETGNAETKWEVLQNMYKEYGADNDAGAAAIKNLFGVNYNKAAQIWQMIAANAGVSWASLSGDTQGDIEAMGGIRLEEETEATQWQDRLNSIEKSMNDLTQEKFTRALSALDEIATNTRELRDQWTQRQLETQRKEIEESVQEEAAKKGLMGLTQNELEANVLRSTKASNYAVGKALVQDWENTANFYGNVSTILRDAYGQEELSNLSDKQVRDFQAFLAGIDQNNMANEFIWAKLGASGDLNGDNILQQEEAIRILYKLFMDSQVQAAYSEGNIAQLTVAFQNGFENALKNANITMTSEAM